MNIEQTIQHYGDLFYLITFLWTALEGETFVLFAGYAASHGLLSLPVLIGCAWLGSFCGDQFYFFLGRRYGVRVIKRFPRWQPGVDRALALLKKHDVGFILSFRFIYGVRNFSSFAMGMSPLAWTRFLILNFIAAGLWALAFCGVGYVFGEALRAMLGDAATVVGIIVLVIFVGVMFVLFKKQSTEEPPPPPPAG